MWLLVRRGLRAHRLRLAASAGATLLGVAFMAGTLILTDTITRSFDQVFTEARTTADVVVRREAAFETRFGSQRTRLDQSELAKVLATEGVAAADGTIEGYAQVVDRAGVPVGDAARGRPTLGQNWKEVATLNPWTIEVGRAPETDNEIVLDVRTSGETGYTIGDAVPVLVRQAQETFIVVGTARFGDVEAPAGASVTLFTTRTAQRVIGEPREVDTIVVRADPGVSPRELTARLEPTLDVSVEVVTADEFADQARSDLFRSFEAFGVVLTLFVAIALVIGTFIVHNTLAIVVNHRTRELALLRVVGAMRHQLVASVLIEALLIGLVAAVLGVGLGIGLAIGFGALLDAAGFDLPSDGTVLGPRTIALALVTGVAMTMIAAMLPARRAGSVSPVTALRDAASEPPRVSIARVLAGAGWAAATVALLAAGLLGWGPSPVLTVGLGGGAALLTLALLGPAMTAPASHVLGRWPAAIVILVLGVLAAAAAVFLFIGALVDLFILGMAASIAIGLAASVLIPAGRAGIGINGRLGRENAIRNPRRTASTASALAVGMAVVAALLIVADSIKASIDQTVDETFRGDFVINSGVLGFGGLPPDLAERIEQLPPVEAAAGLRLNFARVNGESVPLPGIDADRMFRLFDLDVSSGSVSELDADAIAVSVDAATRNDWTIGDRVPVEFATTGTEDFEVVAIYETADLAGDYLVAREAFDRNFADRSDLQIYVLLREGVDPSTGRVPINELLAPFAGATVQDASEFKSAQADQVDQILGLVFVLLFFAIAIAVLGIANTMALSIFERTRELGVLRAVGMTREQLRAIVCWESVIIAMLGTVVGVGLGVVFGWAVMRALQEDGFQAVRIPVVQLLLATSVGALVGVVSALLPARRASRLEILAAIATE